MEQFSDRLTALRDSQHLSQREFARLIGTAHSTVSRWESGQSAPSQLHKSVFKQLERKAEAGGMSYLRFFLSVEEAEGHDMMMKQLYKDTSLV